MSLWADGIPMRGAQDLEDLATASWLSETLFAALELDVFARLGEGSLTLAALAARCAVDATALGRLAQALATLGLVSVYGDDVALTAVARRHLVPGRDAYLGDSLRYRARLARRWPELADVVRSGGSVVRPPEDEDETDYRARVGAYLKAMGDVARHKAGLIAERVALTSARPWLLDVAGGAGAIAARLLVDRPEWQGVVVDLPEVVALASVSDRPVADRLSFVGRDLLSEDLPEPPDGGRGWGVVVASNIVHAYGPVEAQAILAKAVDALARDGLLVVHDFWTDGPARGPAKSVLFDLHMMVNTFQGRTYPWTWARDLLADWGLSVAGPVETEDTALVCAAREPEALEAVTWEWSGRLDVAARELGFVRTVALNPGAVVVAAWVAEKCRFGCSGYDRGAQCPPRSPGVADTRAVLASYRKALLVEGTPPTAEFHQRMLALERAAFLGGHHRALAFTAGPCRLCEQCEPDACRQPGKARPSMEASGIDVYATAAAGGWRLRPVASRDEPATYLGLLLVD